MPALSRSSQSSDLKRALSGSNSRRASSSRSVGRAPAAPLTAPADGADRTGHCAGRSGYCVTRGRLETAGGVADRVRDSSGGALDRSGGLVRRGTSLVRHTANRIAGRGQVSTGGAGRGVRIAPGGAAGRIQVAACGAGRRVRVAPRLVEVAAGRFPSGIGIAARGALGGVRITAGGIPRGIGVAGGRLARRVGDSTYGISSATHQRRRARQTEPLHRFHPAERRSECGVRRHRTQPRATDRQVHGRCCGDRCRGGDRCCGGRSTDDRRRAHRRGRAGLRWVHRRVGVRLCAGRRPEDHGPGAVGIGCATGDCGCTGFEHPLQRHLSRGDPARARAVGTADPGRWR